MSGEWWVTDDYDLFGLRIRSGMPLPDLVEAEHAAGVDVEIALGPVAAPAADAKSVWGLTRDGDGAVLTVEGVARFAIDCGARIRVDPAPGASGRDLRLFLLGSAFGALLDTFADIELIGIPHRVVVSGRGLEAGTFEYRARNAAESENLDRDGLLGKLRG